MPYSGLCCSEGASLVPALHRFHLFGLQQLRIESVNCASKLNAVVQLRRNGLRDDHAIRGRQLAALAGARTQRGPSNEMGAESTSQFYNGSAAANLELAAPKRAPG